MSGIPPGVLEPPKKIRVRMFKYENGKPVIPLFIQEIVKRVYWTGLNTYRLKGTNPQRRAYGIDADFEALKKWAESYGAEVTPLYRQSTRHNYSITFEMSDPAAHALEKAGMLK